MCIHECTFSNSRTFTTYLPKTFSLGLNFTLYVYCKSHLSSLQQDVHKIARATFFLSLGLSIIIRSPPNPPLTPDLFLHLTIFTIYGTLSTRACVWVGCKLTTPVNEPVNDFYRIYSICAYLCVSSKGLIHFYCSTYAHVSILHLSTDTDTPFLTVLDFACLHILVEHLRYSAKSLKDRSIALIYYLDRFFSFFHVSNWAEGASLGFGRQSWFMRQEKSWKTQSSSHFLFR